jgi:succinate dehydrogenase hydrophobic anchor subunit
VSHAKSCGVGPEAAVTNETEIRLHTGAASLLDRASSVVLCADYLVLACGIMAIAQGPLPYARFVAPLGHPLVKVLLVLGWLALTYRLWAAKRWIAAVAAMVLGLWLGISGSELPTTEYHAVVAWFASGGIAAPLLVLLFLAAADSYRGLQALVEDYAHETQRTSLALMIRFVYLLTGVGAALAVLSVALGGIR